MTTIDRLRDARATMARAMAILVRAGLASALVLCGCMDTQDELICSHQCGPVGGYHMHANMTHFECDCVAEGGAR